MKKVPPAKQTAPIKVFFRFAATQLQSYFQVKIYVNAKRYTSTQKYTLLENIKLRRIIILALFAFSVNEILYFI